MEAKRQPLKRARWRTPVIGLLAWLVMASAVIGVAGLLLRGAASAFNQWERSKLGPLHQAACDGSAGEVERLVKGGVPVNATDDDGNTALFWAVYCRRIDVVRKLIDLGADVNHANQWRFTPLMYTATPFRGKNIQGTHAERNAIARLLIHHGADVNHAMGDGRALGSGQTALHFAAKDKNVELVRMLLAAGANAKAKSNQGYTPLDVARFPDYAPNDAVIEAMHQPAQ